MCLGLGFGGTATLAARGTVTLDCALGFLFSETKNLQLKTDNSALCLALGFLFPLRSSASSAAQAKLAPYQRLSSRSRKAGPDFLFRAAFWRVGPRSGGIAA